MNSAIFGGGIMQLYAAVVVALLFLYFIPPEVGNGGTRWRVAGFFVLWQAFTPIRSFALDMTMLALCLVAMEAAYRFSVTRLHAHEKRT